MSSSQNEKKNSDVEIGEASSAVPISRHAENEANRTQPEVSAIPTLSAMWTSAEGNKFFGEATSLAEPATIRVQVPEASVQPSVCEKDLALASIKGSLNEIQLLKGEVVRTLDS
ncbi:unnamed protein product [Eruca vesicaria subsp. sativa]|uniref:Uncharacterized protein n=1 Tax=Eruca vesicaria subsp. sativa TaxID=29727 RepID=A0ABC8IXB2_ERUVS|nr:unnamed protein product [Eruca vesicaria subsp. sativa]